MSYINNIGIMGAYLDIQSMQKRAISYTRVLEKGRRSRIKLKRKKTDEQRDLERWKIDKDSTFSSVPLQYAERKKLELEELQIEQARKLTKDYSDEQLRQQTPKQLYNIIMRQSYAYKTVKRSWLDIFFEIMNSPEQIPQVEVLIKKFQTSGWFGDHCPRIPDQVVDTAIRINRPDWALDFFRDNMTFRFFPRTETLHRLMEHYYQSGDLAGVTSIWQLHKDRGYLATKAIVNTLIKAYVAAGELPSAAWVISKAFKRDVLIDDSNLALSLSFLVNHPTEASNYGVTLDSILSHTRENKELSLTDNANGFLALAHLQNGQSDVALTLASKAKDSATFFAAFETNSALFSDSSLRQSLVSFLSSLKSSNVQYPETLDLLVAEPAATPAEETPVTENTEEAPATEKAEN